jgi:hypothetical protein
MRKILSCFILILILIFPGSALADPPGTLRFNDSSKRYEFYSGSNWYLFSVGVGVVACSKKAALDFNNAVSAYRYCNGTVWIPIVGTPTLIACTKKGAMDFFNTSYHYCNGLVWMNMRGLLFS